MSTILIGLAIATITVLAQGQQVEGNRETNKGKVDAGRRGNGRELGAWVPFVPRNKFGEYSLSASDVQGTWMRTYENRDKNAVMEIHIHTGHVPVPIMMVNTKLYWVDKLEMSGWKKTILAEFEIEKFREHEREWFRAFEDIGGEVRDGTPLLWNAVYEVEVAKSSFEPKCRQEVQQCTGDKILSYSGKLLMHESWSAFLARIRWEVLGVLWNWTSLIIVTVLGSIIAAAIIARRQNRGQKRTRPPSKQRRNARRPRRKRPGRGRR